MKNVRIVERLVPLCERIVYSMKNRFIPLSADCRPHGTSFVHQRSSWSVFRDVLVSVDRSTDVANSPSRHSFCQSHYDTSTLLDACAANAMSCGRCGPYGGVCATSSYSKYTTSMSRLNRVRFNNDCCLYTCVVLLSLASALVRRRPTCVGNSRGPIPPLLLHHVTILTRT